MFLQNMEPKQPLFFIEFPFPTHLFFVWVLNGLVCL